MLTDEQTGKPLPNHYYRMTFKGKVTEGKSDAEGKTEKLIFDDRAEVTIEILPEGYIGREQWAYRRSFGSDRVAD